MSRTVDPYRDPLLYDMEYEGLDEDVTHYTDLASTSPGPVLELGCGTGRLTLPIAWAGATIHGIDASAPMLQGLARKIDIQPEPVARRISFEHRSWYELEGMPKYPLVLLPFNAIHHCQHYDDARRLLDQIRSVLAPGGRLALDCYLPDPSLYRKLRGERMEERTFHDPRTGTLLTSWERGWYDELKQVHHVEYIYQDPDGEEEVVSLQFRMFYPAELEMLLDWSGWRIVERARNFRGDPLTPGAMKCVMTLEPHEESSR